MTSKPTTFIMISEFIKDFVLKVLILVGLVVLIGVPVMYSLHRDDILYEYQTNKTNNSCGSCLNCNLSAEISSYQTVVNNILHVGVNGTFKNKTYSDLATFIDKFGNRIAGSENLEIAINYTLELLADNGLENVHCENVTVPVWIRGKEAAFLLSPRPQQLRILGLGLSVGTPKEGILAEVLVVTSFDELHQRASEAKDKIVVIAEDWLGSYGATVKYRSRAAVEVARVGGVAALIRSITPFSIASPHTGMMSYDANVKKIPAAALTVEDAEMLLRISKRGESIKIILYMDAHLEADAVSRNTVAELRGSSRPDQVVLVSGHLDSWDVGTGAMDDGGGAFTAWAALALLKSLGLRPKRTIRAVLWTAEEVGLVGAKAYKQAHANETDNFIAMIESDEGSFTPQGLEFMGSDEGGCIIQEILKLLGGLNATQFKNSSDVGSDIMLWAGQVSLLANMNENEKYFWFHHSEGDTMTVMDSGDLDRNTALFAALTYVLADISVDLPKPTQRLTQYH